MKLLVVGIISAYSFLAGAQSLPDRIECSRPGTGYQLILLLKSPQIPEGFTAFGLKNKSIVVFKVASQMYKDENGLLRFSEYPASLTSKEVRLNLQTKTAVLNHFHSADLQDGSEFNCQM